MGAAHLDAVKAWRDELRGVDPSGAMATLSPEGARLAWAVAWEALTDEALAGAAALAGRPWPTAAMAVARTVATAPIEWAAVLLSRGTALHLKHPAGEPGVVPLLVEAARGHGLPLTGSGDRADLAGAELLVAMGSDATVEELARAHPEASRLLFGSRFSAAWIVDPGAVEAVALDAALHDGRGCMSPLAVFTPRADLAEALAAAMARAEAEVPRGDLSAEEAAGIRARRALARVVGRVWEGAGWAVLELPADRFTPSPLPRVLAVHVVPDRAQLLARLVPLAGRLSTLGTDDPLLAQLWAESGHEGVEGVRVVAAGQMQRPPLDRLHDGVRWLEATLDQRSARITSR